ncbi:MAG: ABC transporter substrate-binding protein [Treponema sp.]|nr:ABC transporter substrate-binding protein [Treponema sp.]
MKKGFRFVMAAALMLAPAFCLWAGGGRQAQSSASGERTLTVAVGVEPQYMTNMGAQSSGDNDHVLFYNIYDTLVYRDAQGEIKPWLAQDWTISPDGKQIAVTLRDDVYWHNGEKLTASDVKFTYDSLKDKPLGISLLINYDYTEVVDATHLIIHMTNAFKPIMSSFASRIAIVLNEKYYNQVGNEGYTRAPIGTGAYKFVSWASGQIVMERNENWWGGKAPFQRVVIKVIPEVNTQQIALESGDVDVVLAIPIENLERTNDRNISWDYVESNAMNFLQFNMSLSNWATNDLNFRKAVQYGIDKNAINQAVFSGKATLIDMYGSPMFTGKPRAGTYDTYSFNVARAKEYLAQSKYDGREFNVVCQAGTPNQKIAEVIQGSLHNVGINMRVTAVDAATFFDTVRNTGDFDAEVVINTSSIMDMDTLSNYFFISRYDFKDMGHPHGPRMDELIKLGRQQPDDAQRIEYYREFSNLLNGDVNHVYILMDINTIAYRNDRVKGVKANAFKYYRFSEWSF